MQTLKPKLHALIQGAVGSETVIFADQNSPRPELPYWTIRIQSILTVGEAEYIQSDDDNSQHVVGVREATVQVQRFGEDSEIACLFLKANLRTESTQNGWFDNKIACFNIGLIANLTTKLDNANIEERAALDLFVRFGSDLLDGSSGMFNTVNMTGEYETVDTTAEFDANDDLTNVIVSSNL